MTSANLRERSARVPRPYDAERALAEMQDLVQSVALIEDASTRQRATALLEDADARRVIDSLFGNSPFLTRIIRLHPHWLPRLLDEPPSATFDALLARTRAASDLETQAEVMRALRVAKSEAAVLIAFADVTSAWALEEVTEALTAFADAAVVASIEWLLRDAARRGQVLREAQGLTAEGSGLAILG
ncbi:MAG: bifunctional [glutamine synthetase] adenylyltransferase/[glutamine synthetase]-adenylyl-L-tyrosine phosphorylase, partial [Parvibaculum sp.]